jgi:hypothetical protein
MAFFTLSARRGLTVAVPLMTADTVATDTSAKRATSRMVGLFFLAIVISNRIYSELNSHEIEEKTFTDPVGAAILT